MKGEVDFYRVSDVKRYKFFIYLFLFVLAILFCTSFYIEKKKEPTPVQTINSIEIYLNEFEVNELISKNMDLFVGMYASKENISVNVARVIIEKSIFYGVPVNLAFAVAYTESRYSTRVFNYSNSNGSVDYGLFQLNSNTFPDVDRNLFYVENTDLALSYLRWNYNKYGSYDLAIVGYNAGSINRFNPTTQEHLRRVKAKKGELDEWFRTNVRNSVLRDISENKIFTPRPEALSVFHP